MYRVFKRAALVSKTSAMYGLVGSTLWVGQANAQIMDKFNDNYLVYWSEKLCHIYKDGNRECKEGRSFPQRIRFLNGYFYQAGAFELGNPAFPLNREENLLHNPKFRVKDELSKKDNHYGEFITSAKAGSNFLVLSERHSVVSAKKPMPFPGQIKSVFGEFRTVTITLDGETCSSHQVMHTETRFIIKDGSVKGNENGGSTIELDGSCKFIAGSDTEN